MTADTLTKEGAVKEQTEDLSTYGEAKTDREVTNNRWWQKHLDSSITDSYHQLTKKEHVTCFASAPNRILDFEDTCIPSSA